MRLRHFFFIALAFVPAAAAVIIFRDWSDEGRGALRSTSRDDDLARVARGPLGGAQRQLGDPPSIEVYLNDPRKTAPADLVTEVWMPVS